jgi:hypothetical protein
MAILENGSKVSVVIQYQDYTATVVSSAEYGTEGLKYTVELDTPIPYGWDNSLRSEFVIAEKFVKGI